MKPPLNFRHLHYFWVTAQEGSFTRAAERLGVAVQTVSAQIGLLERSLGATLLSPQGRRLVPTEAGRIAMDYASQIFHLGERLRQTVEDSAAGQPLRLRVGISDALPKLIAYRLLAGALGHTEAVRLVCEEGDFDDLIADLALHRLDVVLTDRAAATGSNLRVYNHALGDCEITLFGAPALAHLIRKDFPHGLNGAPLLLPTRDNALRGRLDQWFAARDLRPRVIGEFQDSALLMTFGRGGLGLFPAPAILAEDIAAEYGAVPAGNLAEVREQFYAITAERRIRHPAIEALLAQSAVIGRSV
ncbi:MAG: LysR family transcriptional regulator [Rhodocyclales bacterium]|nr:LysR family transcriptional regulator [Rhodocyclales bacterium]